MAIANGKWKIISNSRWNHSEKRRLSSGAGKRGLSHHHPHTISLPLGKLVNQCGKSARPETGGAAAGGKRWERSRGWCQVGIGFNNAMYRNLD